MSSPLTHEIYANAARSLGWSPFYRVGQSDLIVLVTTHRLEIAWTEAYVTVLKRGGPGHVERIGADASDALFTAVVMCAALIGGAER